MNLNRVEHIFSIANFIMKLILFTDKTLSEQSKLVKCLMCGSQVLFMKKRNLFVGSSCHWRSLHSHVS